MQVWKAYAGNSKLGGKPVTVGVVHSSFSKSRIKACEIEDIFHYLGTIKCNGDCEEHLKSYLISEVGSEELAFKEVMDEFGESQLRLW